MTKKYEKYKKVINKPQQITRRGFDTIKDWTPDNNWWQLLRVPGATVAFNLYLLTWLITRVGFENPLIEKIGDINENRKIKGTAKTKLGRAIDAINKRKKASPTTSAFITYYIALMLFIGGGKIVGDKIFEEEDSTPKKEQQQPRKNTIHNIKIDPNVSDSQWLLQMDAIWPYIYMETILSEGFVDEVYADVGDVKGYLTIGSGFMIGKANPKGQKDIALINERKAFFKKVLGKAYRNGVQISYEENRLLIRKFYEQYIWPQMKRNFTVPMDAHLFIELCIGAFNRGMGIYAEKQDGAVIKNSVNNGASVEQVVNNFDVLCKKGFEGLLPKYGIAAHRALGHISDTDVLNSLANSVYQLSGKKMWKDGILQQYDNIAQDLQNVSNSDVNKNGKTYKQHKLIEYMQPEEVDKIINGDLFVSSLEYMQPVVEQSETTAELFNEQGETFYNSGNYREAIEKFNAAISVNPQMYIVYSNLSIAYYKLGEYQTGVNIALQFRNSKYFTSAPNNVKGYTYYNIALCYEKMGDMTDNINQKYMYYDMAIKHATIGETIANTKYVGFNKRIGKKVSDLQSQKSKVVAFNNGIRNIKNIGNKNNINYTKNNDYMA